MNTPTPSTAALITIAEQSAYRQTGRTDEVERLCAAFAAAWPAQVRSFEYGKSVEGRPLRALIVSRTGTLDARSLKQRNVPLVMIQGGIHPGESDGKDAGFIALREMLNGTVAADALQKVAILFVPAFNTDGHERFGRWNRPNQDGPEEMGWRSTAQNLNLNRDYMKAEAPEMQAMLRLLNEWDPLVCADLHVTDGANFQPDISLQVEPVNQGEPALHATGEKLRDALIERLAAQGSLPLPFYPDLMQTDDPASGFHLTVYSPRFSTGYFAYRNRFTVLVETHSWKNYATRVRITKNTITGLAELVAQHGAQWLTEVRNADKAGAQLAGRDVTLDFAGGWREPTKRVEEDESSRANPGAAEATSAAGVQAGVGANAGTNAAGSTTTRQSVGANESASPVSTGAAKQSAEANAGARASVDAEARQGISSAARSSQAGAAANERAGIIPMPPPGRSVIEFPGYAYTRTPSKISGELVTAYDPSKPEIWRVPFQRDTAPSLTVPAPRGGYVVPVAYAELVGAKLALHGLTFSKLGTALEKAEIQAFRASRSEFSSTPFEGRMTVRLHGVWHAESHAILAGSLFAPIDQPHARLLMALLEPQAPDSLAAWGFFNGCFEKKEYIEPYVAEIVALDMLQSDPKIAREFQSKLTDDPGFAADPTARREFFHQRHGSWDERFNLYPVLRSDHKL
jgi:Zinc carboxypeptidase